MKQTVNKTFISCYYGAVQICFKTFIYSPKFAFKDCKVIIGTSCTGRLSFLYNLSYKQRVFDTIKIVLDLEEEKKKQCCYEVYHFLEAM